MQFSPQSKVWVYQSNRKFTDQETISIQNILDNFIAGWLAHGKELNAKAEILYNFFIVITVDEAQALATGCSIDASVRVIKEIELQYDLDMFNRYNMAYRLNSEIIVASKEDFETLISIGKINADTIVFNNTIQNYQDFQNKWEVPFSESWHQHIFGDLLKRI